jgi:hypothetical protein
MRGNSGVRLENGEKGETPPILPGCAKGTLHGGTAGV